MAELRARRGGSFRRRLAALFGRDEAAADELWRRILHGAGAFVLVYYVLPTGFFLVAPKEDVLLAALGAVIVLEVARRIARLELPTLRPYEARRPASFLFYAVALVVAVLLFPEPIAAAVVVGTAFVDPVAGELRRQARSRGVALGVPWAVYTALAVTALVGVGRWPWTDAVALAAVGGAVAVAAERVRYAWLDDDLTMTVAPALVLWALASPVLGLPG